MANPKTNEPDTTQPEPEPAPPAPKVALVVENADGMLCRPPIGVPIHTLGVVVIGNWFGHIDGKQVTVEHGTPLRGLPAALVKRIRETPEQRVGPYDSRKAVQTGALPQITG